jgi:predicted ABC-type ATPase
MFAGPNGSGKTTLVRRLAREFTPGGSFQLYQYINPDELAAALWDGRGVPLDCLQRAVTAEQIREAIRGGGRVPPDHLFLKSVGVVNSCLVSPAGVADAYVAAAVADFLYEGLLAAGQSFSFETVMSHRAKADLFARARAAGYRTYLYFIATEHPRLNVHRVKQRVALGGHTVPEDKIVERYARCLELVREVLPHAYRAYLFDNTNLEPVWLAQVMPGGGWQFKETADALPAWFKTWVAPHVPGPSP